MPMHERRSRGEEEADDDQWLCIPIQLYFLQSAAVVHNSIKIKDVTCPSQVTEEIILFSIIHNVTPDIYLCCSLYVVQQEHSKKTKYRSHSQPAISHIRNCVSHFPFSLSSRYCCRQKERPEIKSRSSHSLWHITKCTHFSLHSREPRRSYANEYFKNGQETTISRELAPK